MIKMHVAQLEYFHLQVICINLNMKRISKTLPVERISWINYILKYLVALEKHVGVTHFKKFSFTGSF